jgi:microcystin degradation protein MlrC
MVAGKQFGAGPMTFNVLTADFLHETNTFNVHKTGLAEFEASTFLIGDDHTARFEGTNTGLAGCLDSAARFGWNMNHAVSAHASPSGPITTEAFERITNLILDAARATPPDGVLLPLHGAAVPEFCDDGEGELLRRLRGVIGPDIPVAITLDLHANVTKAMCEQAQIIVSYKTYPHIDMREAACHAGDILQRAMAGEISPRTLRAHRPMLCEANGGRTDIGPMVDRIKEARTYESKPNVFAVSINAGFEGSDIAEIGPTVLVTYEGDAADHQRFAENIADGIWARRAEVFNTFHTVEEAADIAADFASSGAPLIVADYADNPGGGGYGDSTALLGALLAKGISNGCFGPMVDPAAANHLHERGEGEALTIDIGGKTDPRFGGGPLTVTGTIVGLSDGICIGDGPMKNGQRINFGPSAVLRVDGIDILVVSEPVQMYDQQQFRAFGIDLDATSVVGLKSMQHFRAAFEPLAEKVIVCDSGALCTPDAMKLPYRNVPRPIFPLDPDMVFGRPA